ncbi:Inosine-uridine preferring nucleoside hydrolase [Fructilactobacillus florum 8D]|uniref:Inosine-uridine preferring nucleoside hydrolase n=1 Tax=Fructilactobacillus florum 8D TaxID=1221538 RepID=W9EHF2_9LACO|nr:nucleoside hydrolase [Fructilactobacillus florum]ETO40696.1 Inosine-uridine preferring nucleoside hydrolase [Fructilactobacillus florum 8D]
MTTRKMILDVDTGVDDAMAITYALADPNVELIGILSSFGNIEADRAAANALKLLQLYQCPQVPVFIGRANPLDHQYQRIAVNAQIHGENGIGDVNLPAATAQIAKQNGVDFLIDTAQKYGEQLCVVTTGPMTNLAAAFAKDPVAIRKIGNITVMGGALTVPGNVTPVAEANVEQDPVAANQLFTSDLKITMVGLDVTLRTLLTKQETSQWRTCNPTAGAKLADIVDFYIDVYDEIYPELGGCSLHDPLAVGVAIDPSFVTTIPLNLLVTTEHDAYYARTIGDKARLNEPTNLNVAVGVDRERYLNVFMKLFLDFLEKLN